MRQITSKRASATPAVAALDLGTNSFLLLLLRENAGGGLERVSEACRIVRLGQDVGRTGRLAPAAIARGLAAVRELWAETPWAGTAGVGIAAATSAVRDAANRDEFLAPCAEILGSRPLLLSGADEARTVFAGASSELPPGQSCVCLDIGGGSTELAAGFAGDYRAGLSVNVGCVRLAERFGLENAAAPAAMAAARAAITTALAPPCAQVLRTAFADSATSAFTGPAPAVWATGGTANTAASALTAGACRGVFDHHTRLSANEVEATALRLLTLDAAARARQPGVPTDRAAVLPTGMLILAGALRLLGAAEATVSTRGLRYGLALRLRAGALAPVWRWPRA
ncbi:MAG: hypothetical protein WC708_14455 [Lentisphaeria bacterium]